MFVHGVPRDAPVEVLDRAIETALLEATGDLSWLAAGDRVLLKPAMNSGDPYPATTHPQALISVARVLRDRGAEVIVGDKPGVAYVLADRGGSRKQKSRALFERCGMSCPDLRFVGFEERDWDEGFYKFEHPHSSWPNGFYLTRWVDEVDHVINLPRLSSHAQTGVTLGFKSFVGLLRDDSRMCFHANGPYHTVIRAAALGADLDTSDDGAGAFFEKITDISLATAAKLRCTLFVATRAQVTFGPDRYSLAVGKRGILPAHVQIPDTGLVFASSDQVAAEVTAIAFLSLLHSQAPWLAVMQDRMVHALNRSIGRLGSYGAWDHPFVRHALAVGLGQPRFDLHHRGVPEGLRRELDWRIARGPTARKHAA